jgi:hypothetical protein
MVGKHEWERWTQRCARRQAESEYSWDPTLFGCQRSRNGTDVWCIKRVSSRWLGCDRRPNKWVHSGAGGIGRFWTYDPNANPTGFGAVDQTTTVSENRKTYHGKGSLQFFDNNGNSLGPPTTILDDGTRITFP